MEYFITGVDTEIGKTFITKWLASGFESIGKTVGVYKPMQSGAMKNQDGTLSAPDLEEVKSMSKTIKTKCSYLMEGEVSPALAARLQGINVNLDLIKQDFNEFVKNNDVTLVEGAGGILAPITDKLFCADLIKSLNLPVILVTVPFLGRINHTLLTLSYIYTNNIPIKGIIVNRMPQNTTDLATKNFVNELELYTNIPILGVINECETKETSERNLRKIFSAIASKL